MIRKRQLVRLMYFYRRAESYVEQHPINSQIAAALGINTFYLVNFIANAAHPKTVKGPDGWWRWWDQSQYLKGALGFANGSLAADNQWYMPGYSLLAAIIYKLFHIDPFLLLDGGLLITGFMAFQKLAKLFGLSALTAMLVFILSALVPPHLFEWTWVVPWTTTPQAVCILFACGFALKAYRDHRPRDSFLFGLSASAVALFRPVDALAILAPGSCALILTGLCTRTISVRARLRLLGALSAGVAAIALFGFLIHMAVYGFELSPYMRQSRDIGFEWRLIPVRWVALFIDSRPLYNSSRGLFEQCPWLVFGIAGILSHLIYDRKDRVLHGIIAAMLIGYISLYLAYRDWHSTGLWKWGSVHYFTWIMPILGLYACLWLLLLKRRFYRQAVVGLVLTLLLLCWRLVPCIIPADPGDHVEMPRTVIVHEGLAHIDDAIFVAAHNLGVDSDLSPHHLWINDQEITDFFDYRVFPTDNGMLIFPLRPLPPGSVRIQFADDITLKGTAPVYLQQKIRFSLPCWIATRQCRGAFAP